jgi:NAD(P)-dependent dehydrogenase (short-subunit alcohol dehydrogenase family)
MNFNDKVVVVTGGSKGFGKGLAQAFIKDDARVIITSTDGSELVTTAKEIGADSFVADASSYEATSSLADYVMDKYGRIDVWLNNAGIQIAPSNAEDIEINKLHRLFDVNFFGYFYGCMAALRVMKKQGDGLIININSTAGLSGKPCLSAYVSSKFAIKGMTESIREENKNGNVKLYQVFPGGMQTDIYHEEIPSDISEYMHINHAIDKVMANLKSDTPEQDLVIKRPTIS